MKAAFPHFGPVAVAVSNMFRELGIPFVIPSYNDKNVLRTGAGMSPEEMCLPFKYMAGNLKEAYDKGADTAVMAATCGPCRLGEYGQLLMEIMEREGCHYQWVLLDSPSAIGMREFTRRCSTLLEGRRVSKARLVKSIYKGIKLIFAMDKMERELRWKAGFADEPQQCMRLLHSADRSMKAAEGFKEAFDVIKKVRKQTKEIKCLRDADPIRILVAGEIYTSVEKEANGRLEEKLMKMGCSVHRHMTVSWWIKRTLADVFIPDFFRDAFTQKKGIPCGVGGYGRETVRKIINSSKYDGVIKIMPSGCMPEIVTKSFCENQEKDMGIRLLNLIYDEMEGNAGYETRIEAFVDMLERRKNVLAGSRHRIHKHGFGFNR